MFKLRPAPPLFAAILAASASLPARAADNPLPTPTATTSEITAISSVELWLAGGIIAFGFVVLAMQFVLLRRSQTTQPEDILRLFTVTMIIVGTLALIAIGYSSQQIAPALGLFGTILGYLLGKTDERARNRPPPPPAAPGP